MTPYKTVELPHIRHTVKFFDLSNLKGIEIKGSGYTAKESNDITIVFFEDIENTVKDFKKAPWVAHELTHVLQIINEKLSSQFESEVEHMAYIMHYLWESLID